MYYMYQLLLITINNQVRTAAVFVLGTYILNGAPEGEQSEHAKTIERGVAMMLLPMVTDGSPLVRQVCYYYY